MAVKLPNLIPPFRFTMVEENLFRGGYPKPRNKRFLKRLRLKTILSLIPEKFMPEMQAFCTENNISLLHLTVDKMKEDNIPLTYNKTLMALQLMIDPANHPLYIHCLDGADVTGLVVACLRKLQMWSISSALGEFVRNLHTNVISSEEFEFVENFKSFEVTIPTTLPVWLWGGQVNFRKHTSLRLKFLDPEMMTEEERELKDLKEKKEKEKEDYYKKRKNDLLDNLFDPNTPAARHRSGSSNSNLNNANINVNSDNNSNVNSNINSNNNNNNNNNNSNSNSNINNNNNSNSNINNNNNSNNNNNNSNNSNSNSNNNNNDNSNNNSNNNNNSNSNNNSKSNNNDNDNSNINSNNNNNSNSNSNSNNNININININSNINNNNNNNNSNNNNNNNSNNNSNSNSNYNNNNNNNNNNNDSNNSNSNSNSISNNNSNSNSNSNNNCNNNNNNDNNNDNSNSKSNSNNAPSLLSPANSSDADINIDSSLLPSSIATTVADEVCAASSSSTAIAENSTRQRSEGDHAKDPYLVDVDVDVDGVMMDGLDQVEYMNRTIGESSANRFYDDPSVIDSEGDIYNGEQSTRFTAEPISRTLEALALEGLTEF